MKILTEKFLPILKLIKGESTSDKSGRVGKYFNVVEWNLIVRPTASIVAGMIIAMILLFVDWIFGFHFMNGWIFGGVTLSMVAFFAQSESEDEVIPEAHVAMLTFWGMRIRVYRKEGEYSWTGKRLGLGRSKTVHSEGTDGEGFVRFEAFPFSVWNNADKEVIKLEILAGDTSSVRTTLTLTLMLLDPYLWLSSGNPALDLGEQARTAFRTAISFFTGVDCAAIKSVFVNLMEGNSILTAFLKKNEGKGGYPKGSIFRNQAGTPQYKIVDKEIFNKIRNEGIESGKDTEQINNETDALVEKLKSEFTSTRLKDVDFSNVQVEFRTVESSFDDVLKRLGVKLVKAAVGDIDLSNEVTAEANRAASEVFQRSRQVASAETLIEVQEIMSDGNKAHPLSDLDKGIAAAQDNPNVKVVVTGGGNNSLKDAAATHATLTRGD